MNNLNIILHSPLDQFEVVNLLGINAPLIGNINLQLTNLGLYSLLILVLIIGLHLLSNNENSIIPSKWSIVFESIYVSVLSMVRGQIGSNQEIYLPFIYSLFFFIIIANLTGNIPYNFTITTSIITSIGLSFIIFIGVTITALYNHNLKFFSSFVPGGTPLPLVPLLVLIELTSYVSRAFSLGIRLFCNMLAGHALMNILSTFLFKLFKSSILVAVVTLIPFALFIAIMVLELAVSAIQAYVFCILTCSYIAGSIYLH